MQLLGVSNWVIPVAVLAALTACGDDDQDPTPTPSPAVAATPTPEIAELTGIAAVDAVIRIVAAEDADALISRAYLQDVTCSALPGNMCADAGGDRDSLVRVLPGAICDDNPVPEGDLDLFASHFLGAIAEGPDVNAAWRAEPLADGPPQSVPEGAVRVLWNSGASLVVSEDGEVWYVHYGCGSVEEVLGFEPTERRYLIEPLP